jgi:hypothetical protein
MSFADAYGRKKLNAAEATVGRFLDVLRREGDHGGVFGMHQLDGIDISPTEHSELQALRGHALELASGVGGAALSGAAASAGTVGLVGLLGTASTGTAIAGLSGAAAQSATLAWLGGGSLAAGGGGVAMGSMVLGGIALAPAVFVGGFMLAAKGNEAISEARGFEADVAVAVAELDAVRAFLGRAKKRVQQLDRVLGELTDAVAQSLDQVDAEPDAAARRDALHRAAVLVRGVAELLRTPVLDASGKLTAASARLVVRSRELLMG